MKKAFTILELLIAISILSIIMIVVIALYRVAIREYPINLEKTRLQTKLNFAADAMVQNAKSGFAIPPNYDSHTRSSSVFIIESPAIDNNGNMIYNGSVFEKDVFIYSLSQGKLIKQIYGYSLGRNAGQNGSPQEVLTNVTDFSCDYSHQIDSLPNYYKTAVCNIALSSQVGGSNINFNITKTVNLRNAP